MNYIHRYYKKDTSNFFLFGPRGTGKSTLLEQQFTDAIFIDLLESDIYRSYLAKPERLIDVIQASGKKIIVIDEIQRIPELLRVVHKLIEQNKGALQFILTGSSARKLRKSGVDLLAGRAIVKTMHPFMASEQGELFLLENALLYGMVPVVVCAKNTRQALKAYINVYIEQEIKAEGLVRNLDNFSRFLEAISFSHGSVINTSEIARECEVKRSTVIGYIGILEDLLLSKNIAVFTKRAKRGLVSHTKFYFFDTGVFRALRPSGKLDRAEEIDGQALEGLVLQHLQAWIDHSEADAKIYFWRTKSGVEVDFVIYGNSAFYAIEVKNTQRIRSDDLTGLNSFFEDYPECTAILLYRGKEKIMQGPVTCIPVETFLKELRPFNALI